MTASSTPPVGGQVPDDTRAWRDALAEAAQAELACGTAWYIATGESIAAALLPTVARIVAQELRKLADEMDSDGSHWAASWLRARADDLEAGRG